jgi:hypothetical protein
VHLITEKKGKFPLLKVQKLKDGKLEIVFDNHTVVMRLMRNYQPARRANLGGTDCGRAQ